MAPANGESAQKQIRPDYTDTITVFVGPQQKPFSVHTAIIRSKSPFFASATSKNWSEGKRKVVELPETEPEMFHTYLHWVYASKVDMSLMPELPSCADDYEALTDLWIFADMMLDHPLCNQVANLILKEYQAELDSRELTPTTLRYMWEQTSDDSLLRVLLMDVWLNTMEATTIKDYGPQLPREFLVDLAMHCVERECRKFLDNVLDDATEFCHYYHIAECEDEPCSGR